MNALNEFLIFVHFIGLAMGMTVTFSNIVIAGLIARAASSERTALEHVPSAIMRLSRPALSLLWVSGVALVYTRWDGFAVLPWQFHVKLAAVVLLTVISEYIHRLDVLAHRGDTAALARIETFGKTASACAIVSVLFAVLTFD